MIRPRPQYRGYYGSMKPMHPQVVVILPNQIQPMYPGGNLIYSNPQISPQFSTSSNQYQILQSSTGNPQFQSNPLF